MLFAGFLVIGVAWFVACGLIARELVVHGDVFPARVIVSLGMSGFMFPVGVWIVVRCDAPPGYQRAQQDLIGGAMFAFLLGAALFGGGAASLTYSQPFTPWGAALEVPGVVLLCVGAWGAKMAWRSRGTSSGGELSALPPPPRGSV